MENNFIAGAQSQNDTGIRFFTGLGAVRVRTVNPTLKELNELLGREPNKDEPDPLSAFCDYSLRQNPNTQIMERPLVFWLESVETEEIFPFSINVANQERTFSTGKRRVINNQFQDSIADSIEAIQNNPNMGWFKTNDATRYALIGEYNLYWFLSKLILFNPRADKADWYKAMQEKNMTIEDIYNGNYDGLRALIDFANANDNSIIALHIVKESENDEGRIRRRQEILANPDTWFRTNDGRVTQDMIDKIERLREDAINRGRELSETRYYTILWQQYQKDECINYSPDDIPQTGAAPAATKGWMS